MLFLGAAGKSAQIPLQTWLADAMAGPTPVSALIHAATMVTAGVYLCCRMFSVFELAPEVMLFISITGAVTLLVAGFAALVQTDIKRILAYSTMSQLGYMFMAVGAEAYQAGLFHMLNSRILQGIIILVFWCGDFGLPSRTKHFQNGWLVLQEQIPICMFRDWWRCIGSDSILDHWFLLKRRYFGSSLDAKSYRRYSAI